MCEGDRTFTTYKLAGMGVLVLPEGKKFGK